MRRFTLAAVLAAAALGTVACDAAEGSPPPAPVSVPAVPPGPAAPPAVPAPPAAPPNAGAGNDAGTVAPPPAVVEPDDLDDDPDDDPDDVDDDRDD